ncbi:MAG: hypothetical protein HYR91_11590 [Flavobacteriia bacterium]|nr:hypothetical protein [Flavobacteriia bacterium]
MAGGKETPRQKMVGLMYLVLMALLALNVTKAVLDAFVAIEENLQVGTLAQLDRGDAAILSLKDELNDPNPEKVKKVKYYLTIAEKINQLSAARIKEIDQIKIDCMKEMSEIVTPKDKDELSIVWKDYDAKDPNRPAKLHLMAVQAKDGYDVPMHHIIGQDLAPVTGVGKQLWENYNQYRLDICATLGTYQAPGGKPYTFKAEGINKFKDNIELDKMVETMMAKNTKYNAQDDKEVLKEIYLKLTKQEFIEHEGTEMHWIAKTFDHSPIVAAIASLTALQQEVLAARATALQHLKGKVSTGEYSFNKVMALAYGPASANQGDEFEVKVMMAAYDSDNQPVVTTSTGTVDKANSKDGYGLIKAKGTSGPEMTLKGTVSIKKKSGEMKKEPWELKVVVMKPQGTVSLPDMNVVYRGYPNLIVGVASGYEETILNGTNISLKKGANGSYIGTPGAGRECSISVAGRNKAANKTVQLGKFPFRVSGLPSPQVYLGSLATGMSAGKSAIAAMTRLSAKYPPEIPLKAEFNVDTWEVTVSGAPRPASGKGPILSPEALSLLKQARPGSKIAISVKYKGMGTSGFQACVVSVQ